MLNLAVNGIAAHQIGYAVLCTATITDYAAQTAKLRLCGTNGTSSVIHWGDGSTTTCSHTGSYVVYDHDYSANGTYYIHIYDCRSLTCLATYGGSISYQPWLAIDLTTLKYMPNVEEIDLLYSGTTGSFDGCISMLTSLVTIRLTSNLSPTSLRPTGSLSEFSDMVNMEDVQLAALVNVSGDLSDLSELVSLDRLYLQYTSTTGNISDIGKCPISSLNLGYTNVDTYTASALSWANLNGQFAGLTGLDAAEISQMLQDVDDLSNSNGTLNYSGCGVAYADLDAAGQTAHDNLTGRGWDITMDT